MSNVTVYRTTGKISADTAIAAIESTADMSPELEQFVEAKLQVLKKVCQSNKIFSITYLKKDGSIREMLCIKKYKNGNRIVGSNNRAKPSDPNILTVNDKAIVDKYNKGETNDKGFRRINVKRILDIRCGDIEFNCSDYGISIDAITGTAPAAN